MSGRGLFCSLHVDRGSHHFDRPKAGGKVTRSAPTQVEPGNAAQHPSHRAYSDADISPIQAADRAIARSCLPAHTPRFGVEAYRPGSAFLSAWRPASRAPVQTGTASV